MTLHQVSFKADRVFPLFDYKISMLSLQFFMDVHPRFSFGQLLDLFFPVNLFYWLNSMILEF